ncbi:hypothetical protein C8R47DRAFT_1323118 [Mycena vitilis]|nr:hypothetical protein C8R47DRAFT_1323118 [Mycena vitilis]
MDQPVDQLWFSPGVVILRKKSSVFAGMFTLPQPPPSDMETMGGVPVVNVHDDPVEMEVFLKAIFDSSFFMPPPAESDISQSLGILRLAHKYDVPYLRRRALEHLGTLHPTRLSEWNVAKLIPPTTERLSQRLATIATATEVGALWLLPTTYYALCRRRLSPFVEDSRWIALGDVERKACILGYPAQILQTPKILEFLSVLDDNCEASAACNSNRLRLTRFFSVSVYPNNPLDCWDEELWNAVTGSICDTCVESSRLLHSAARQKCWDGLPEMFGLPSWEILEGMRAAALAT